MGGAGCSETRTNTSTRARANVCWLCVGSVLGGSSTRARANEAGPVRGSPVPPAPCPDAGWNPAFPPGRAAPGFAVTACAAPPKGSQGPRHDGVFGPMLPHTRRLVQMLRGTDEPQGASRPYACASIASVRRP